MTKKENLDSIYIRERIIMSLAEIVGSRDVLTGGHVMRSSEVVQDFALHLFHNKCGLSKDFLSKVIRAAPLHDLGKIAVSDSVLLKNGKYTDEEYACMKKHAAEGAKVVERILNDVESDDFVQVAVNVAHYHHEKWDGSGYPDGLSGEDIPIEARIMAFADVFDALVSKRCYKPAFSYDKAFSIIEESLGSHFDPFLGKEFLKCKDHLIKLYDGYES